MPAVPVVLRSSPVVPVVPDVAPVVPVVLPALYTPAWLEDMFAKNLNISWKQRHNRKTVNLTPQDGGKGCTREQLILGSISWKTASEDDELRSNKEATD